MSDKRFQVYLSDQTQAWLERRSRRIQSNASTVPQRVKVELDLWRWHLAEELRSTTWTLGEIGCLADILNGTPLYDKISGALWAELADAFEDVPGAWGQKWGIDEEALVAKTRTLGPTAQHALTEAIVSWWASGQEDSTYKEDLEHSVDGWARVGVRVVEAPADA